MEKQPYSLPDVSMISGAGQSIKINYFNCLIQFTISVFYKKI